MTAHRSVTCPRCHAAPGAPCTTSAPVLHTLDGATTVHGARTVLAAYAHTLDRLNTRDRHAVRVSLDHGPRSHRDGRVNLAASVVSSFTGALFTWHVYRGEVLDHAGHTLGTARSIAAARHLVAAAMLGREAVPA